MSLQLNVVKGTRTNEKRLRDTFSESVTAGEWRRNHNDEDPLDGFTE